MPAAKPPAADTATAGAPSRSALRPDWENQNGATSRNFTATYPPTATALTTGGQAHDGMRLAIQKTAFTTVPGRVASDDARRRTLFRFTTRATYTFAGMRTR
jgi:hypothetical protein